MEIEDDTAGPYSEPNASGPHPGVKFRLRFNIILQSTPRFSKIMDNTFQIIEKRRKTICM